MSPCQGCGKETDLVTRLGPVMLCVDECYPDAMIEVEEANEKGESIDVRLWARRRYNRLHDKTVGDRVQRRNKQLNAMAQELGFDGLSQMLTAWKNGEIKITVERTAA